MYLRVLISSQNYLFVMNIMLLLPVLIDRLIIVGLSLILVEEGALSASSIAKRFFDNLVRFFGIPGEVM